MDKNKNREISFAVKRRKSSHWILKFLLISAGSVVLLLVVFVEWIYFSVFFGPGPQDYSGSHPFKSEKAKAEYFSFENTMAKKWPILSEERLVQTSFGKTFMRVSGPVDAPPLVLLPGGATNSIIWNANIQALSRNYRTYALDNIYDYGRSVYACEMKTGVDMAGWLNELFDTLRLGNDIRIMGYSYGGWVTSQYALYHPERLNHVVLIAPVFTVYPLSGNYILRMLTTLIPVRHFKSKIMYWVWADLAQKGESGKQLVEDRIDYYQTALKCFKFKQTPTPTVLTDAEFQRLTMPVLFMVGNHETVYDPKSAIERIKRVNPKIRTELILGTGHDLMFTHTEVVNQKVLGFLESGTNEENTKKPQLRKSRKPFVKR